VIIDLKVSEFQPEFAGKMNFYLSAVDEQLKHKDDQPSIGIILCKTKNKLIVEYTLRDTNKPMGVSTYQLTESLPRQLKGSLPTVEELEAELGEVDLSPDTKIGDEA
jgi:YhcG PDDEXK nuclease domain